MIRARRIGFAVIGAQLVFLLGFSVLQYSRFVQTWDFVGPYQAWSQMAHGHLDPSIQSWSLHYVHDHGELIQWPLGLLFRLWPSGLLLLFVADVAVAGAEAVAFSWIVEIVAERVSPKGWQPRLLIASGAALLVANPWVYWSLAFDYHEESLATLFAVLAAREFYRGGHWRAIVWTVLLLSTGDIAGTYAVGIAVMLICLGRFRQGLTLAAAGGAWVALFSVLHLNEGSSLIAGYGYLAVGSRSPATLTLSHLVVGALAHPQRAILSIWSKRTAIWANLAPAGWLGLISPVAGGLTTVVLLTSALHSSVLFVQPGFQTVVVYVLAPVGTVYVVSSLARRRPRLASLLAAGLGVNALIWATVWLPRLDNQWVRVSPGAAAVLRRALHQIPPDSEVIASQGVAGRFAARPLIYAVQVDSGAVPVRGDVWFILAPSQGTETAPVNGTLQMIAAVARLPGAALVDQGAGIFVFRWRAPLGAAPIIFPGTGAAVGGWEVTGDGGAPEEFGPVSEWAAGASGSAGYVVRGDYWRERAGRYQVSVRLATDGPVDVEARDATSKVLLWREALEATGSVQTVTTIVDLRRIAGEHAYQGWGPFRSQVLQPARGDNLELRVWTPGGVAVSVYSLSVRPVGQKHRPPASGSEGLQPSEGRPFAFRW